MSFAKPRMPSASFSVAMASSFIIQRNLLSDTSILGMSIAADFDASSFRGRSPELFDS